MRLWFYERNEKKIYEKGYFLHSMKKVTFFIIYEEGNLSHRKIFMRKVTFFINFLWRRSPSSHYERPPLFHNLWKGGLSYVKAGGGLIQIQWWIKRLHADPTPFSMLEQARWFICNLSTRTTSSDNFRNTLNILTK